MPAVLHALKMANEQMGVARSVQTLALVNQQNGFDCRAARGRRAADAITVDAALLRGTSMNVYARPERVLA